MEDRGGRKETSGAGAWEPCSWHQAWPLGPWYCCCYELRGQQLSCGGLPSPGSRTLLGRAVDSPCSAFPLVRVARGRKQVQFCPPACSRSDGVTTPPSPSADTEWQSGHVWQQRSSARQDHAAAAAAARAAPELLPAQSPCSSASVSIPSGQTGARGAGRAGSPRVCSCAPVPQTPLPWGEACPDPSPRAGLLLSEHSGQWHAPVPGRLFCSRQDYSDGPTELP